MLPFRIKLVSLIVLMGILLLGVMIFSFFTIQKPSKQTTYTAFPTNYPTISQTSTYVVTSVFPQPDKNDASVTSAIRVVFSRPLTTREQAVLTLSITPSIQGTYQWDTTFTAITFLPQKHLANNQQYLVSVMSTALTYSWKFTTTSLALDQDVQNAQQQADRKYADQQKQTLQSYPWINDLPIQTATYFAYFDTDEKKLVAKIYPQTNSEEEIKKLQNEVIERLHAFGIDTDAFPIQWTITRP